jgi:osmoprotectant transport system ATP-binding protein
MGVAFELQRVVKRHGQAIALGPIDLQIEQGRTTALIGPSGAGKSTLLRLLNGLVTPDEGQVLCFGRPLAGQDLPALRRQIGYVIQGGGLFPHLDVAGNAALVAHHLGWDDSRIAARLRELLALVRLPDDTLSRFPVQLSGGQAQRVGLVRALLLDPPALLLDEPLGALDPLTRLSLQDDLREVFARLGKTVVLVTHDLAEAQALAERAVLLRDGAIAQQGSVRALVEAPADEFVARFVRTLGARA